MNDQKRENLLNLSLDATTAERAASSSLSTGYDFTAKTWEVIVQYQGDISFLEQEGVRITYLFFQYAILTLPEQLVDYVTKLPQITYMEMPKRLFFADFAGRSISCIQPLQESSQGFFGDGVLLACIDSGVDYTHPAFRNADGSTRIFALWDQTIPGSPPENYPLGTQYTRQQINEALSAPTPEERNRLVPSRDTSGHGTAVLGIAAGGGGSEDSLYRGVASKAILLVIKLGSSEPDSFPRTTQLMMAVDYAVRTALFLQKPLAINLSFGNNYGSHSGTSLLETYLNQVSRLAQNVICIGSGNEGISARHAAGNLSPSETKRIEFAIGPYEPSMSLQLWKSYTDTFDITIVAPDGTRIGPLQSILGAVRFRVRTTEILLYYGMPSPHSQAQEIYLDLLPSSGQSFINSGIWAVELHARTIVMGNYDLWLPGFAGTQTRFYLPDPETTLTIPSTARYAITVGAYNPRFQSYADFSGRGYTRFFQDIKPDLCAPGVDISAPVSGGGYGAFTGTSFAVPFVTGSAALMMEWGILYGNDPFLYGEKLKAFLIRGARRLPSESVYPNPRLGYGVLCLQDSFPV